MISYVKNKLKVDTSGTVIINYYQIMIKLTNKKNLFKTFYKGKNKKLRGG